MRSIRFRVVDVVVLAVVSGVGVSLVSAAMVSHTEIEHRIKCASNLRQLGMAIMLYADENRGAYPRTTYKPEAAPVWGTPYPDDATTEAAPVKDADPFADEKRASKEAMAVKPAVNDVTASLYLLLRTQDIVPEVFVCPSTHMKRFQYDGKGAGALEYTNFPGKAALARSLSYSYQNPYASAKAISAGFKLNNSITAEFAVMADMNPGGDAVLKVTATSPMAEARKANSLNHRGDGQNVLYGDGHIEFVQNPCVGVKRDNIYTANGPLTDTDRTEKREGEQAIVASPADANDSILLPTAADLGQVPNETLPVTPGDPAALQKALLGTYGTRTDEGKPAALTIDDNTLKMVSGPMTVLVNYKVLGTRGAATVIEVSAEGIQTTQIEVRPSGRAFIMEGDLDWFNNAWVRRE